MIELRSASPADTASIGGAVAGVVVPGDVVLLCGDLGAGKTVLAKAFGAALGVAEPITSPTFTIVRQYDGRLRLYHLDVYRIEVADDLAELGLAELLDEGAVVLIEWGDAIAASLPQDFLEVHLHLGDGDDDRRLELVTVGPRWQARLRVLRERTGRWAATGGVGSC